MATAIGPVGPEISAWVPQNNEANSPTATAPYRPAMTPNPDTTP